MVFYWILIGIVLLILIECVRENFTFRVTHYQITTSKLSSREQHNIVFLSDLHGNTYGKQNIRLLDAIRRENPEFALIGGDMLVGSKLLSPEVAEDFVKELAKICPVYYANGNHEQRLKEVPEIPGTDYEEYRNNLVNAGVKYLENEKACLKWGNHDVEIYGLELPYETYTKFRRSELPFHYIEHTIGKSDNTKYQILMAHNPAYVSNYAAWGADLVVSGHLHGGIARIPFWRGVISPQGRIFPKYSGELSRIDNTSIVVSKGMGCHSIKIRFFNPAEVVVLHVGGVEE